jgi:hypothetical protein
MTVLARPPLGAGDEQRVVRVVGNGSTPRYGREPRDGDRRRRARDAAECMRPSRIGFQRLREERTANPIGAARRDPARAARARGNDGKARARGPSWVHAGNLNRA